MKVMQSEWRDRLDHWIRTLRDDIYRPLGEMKWEACRIWEHISAEEAEKLAYEPVCAGYTWGELWEYCWFRTAVTLPETAEGQRIVMNLSPGGESTLFVNGQSFGTYRADWIWDDLHYISDNVLTGSGRAGERFEIRMETYAGQFFAEAPSGGCATGPVLPGSFADPLQPGARRTLGVCTYGIWNEDAYRLYMDVKTLHLLLETLDSTSLRAVKIAEALEQFTLMVDFEQGQEERNADYRAAAQMLRPALDAENGSTQPVFYAVGNAHIDLAWLWPMAETHRKTARTFAAQLRMIEEYPEYKYIQSQPAAYEMCRQYYPELFERIKEAVKGGQWIAEGAMWVEPDTNMAGGEALIRQLIHGKRYYKEMFDVDSQVLWLPDTFGYTGALPQILKGCGVKYLVTQKIFWSYNEGEQFPYHYFTWRGMDGSEVVSFLPTSYTYKTDPVEVNNVWKNRSQVRDLEAFLFPYGYGDGGGGPTRDHVEFALRQKNLEGGVKIKMAGPREFFEEMQEKGGPKNTYVGELYFSAHRGTYTSQAMVKKNNRRCELSLREMEMWSSLAMLNGWEYPLEQADALWKKTLLHQFHDILPGSSIARVYHDAEKAFGEILQGTEALTQKAMAALLQNTQNTRMKKMPETDGETVSGSIRGNEVGSVVSRNAETGMNADSVTVWNSLSFARRALVTLPENFADGAVLADGTLIPTERTVEGIKALAELPPCGMISLRPMADTMQMKGPETAVSDGANAAETTDGFLLENSQIRALINKMGEVTSFILKESGREFAQAPMNRFRLYKDVPRLFDAWDIDSHYVMQEIDAAYDVNVEIEAQGIEAVLKVTGKISASEFTQRIRLTKDSRRIEFETEMDWKELHRLLKTSFPVTVYAENGINEMQFGYVERPTHRSRAYEKDRFEVCNHRYSALCDGAHGAAILNDCKYGLSMNGNALELTLLRAAAAPEMRADNRVHRFTYAFTAWEGSFVDSDVARQGYELNVPALVTAGGSLDYSFLCVDRANIFVDTVKPAEDGSADLVLRLYEAKKAAGKAKLHLSLDGFRAYACDMLENVMEELPVADGTLELDFRAFEVKTVRIVR